MIDYSKLQYLANSMELFKRENVVKIRGRTYKIEVGYVLKIARENLKSQYMGQRKYLSRDLDGVIGNHTLDELMFITQNEAEFTKILSLLKKDYFKTRYTNLNTLEDEEGEQQKKFKKVKDANYDSEDPEEYKDINLFNGHFPAPASTPTNKYARKSNAKPLKSKIIDPEKEEEKH